MLNDAAYDRNAANRPEFVSCNDHGSLYLIGCPRSVLVSWICHLGSAEGSILNLLWGLSRICIENHLNLPHRYCTPSSQVAEDLVPPSAKVEAGEEAVALEMEEKEDEEVKVGEVSLGRFWI